MEIIWYVIVGAVVGALGRFINPGPDPMGWILTILIGIAAVVIVGILVPGGLLWSIIIGAIVAAVLVTVVQRFLPGSDRRARA